MRARPWILAPLCTVSCSAASLPPEPQVAASQSSPALSAPAPLLRAARWERSAGATVVGPRTAAGTLVLLGGRLSVHRDDGTLARPATEPPEPLVELIEVPAARGRVVVARGARGIYRYDDPLAAPARLATAAGELRAIGAGPGFVAVWERGSDRPRFLDVQDGRPADGGRWPILPARSIAFRTMQEGVAVFHGAGPAVTTDGGATWTPVASAKPGEALRMQHVRADASALRVLQHEGGGPEAVVDVTKARFEAAKLPAEISDEPALLRFVRSIGRDPLEAAVAAGVVGASPDVALVASHGMLATIELGTGRVARLAPLSRGAAGSTCATERAGAAVLVACALGEDAPGELYDPFGVLRLSGRGSLEPGRPEVVRNGDVALRTSPSGGAMLLGPCDADQEGNACVRQPSGKWLTLGADADLEGQGAGPLADGRVAFLRGVGSDEGPGAEVDSGRGTGRGLRIVALERGTKEKLVATLSLGDEPSGELRVLGSIEEDEDRALHVLLSDDENAYAIVQAPGEGPTRAHRLAGVRAARLHAGRGLAVADRRLLASRDGGATWSEIAAPEPVLDAAERVARGDDGGFGLEVTEVGARFDEHLLVGWGEPARLGPPRDEPPGPVLEPRRKPLSSGPEMALACTNGPPAASAAMMTQPAHARAALEAKAPAREGVRRETSLSTAIRWSTLGSPALLTMEGPKPAAGDRKPGRPATWILRWIDPLEIGSKVREWKGKAPEAAAWGTTLRAAASRGAHALFSLRTAGKALVVRTKAGGGIEVAEIAAELAPAHDVAFAENGKTVAWLADDALVVWTAKQPPQAATTFARTAIEAIGAPANDGVPLLLGGPDWSALRLVPLPGKAKEGEGAPDRSGLASFVAADALRPSLGRLPACAPGAKPSRTLLLSRSSVPMTLDGADATASQAVYAVGLQIPPPGSGATADLGPTPPEACIRAIAAQISAPPRPRPPGAPAGPARPGKHAPGATAGATRRPTTFVRADLAGTRAEGGELGGTGQDAVRRLSCTLAPKP